MKVVKLKNISGELMRNISNSAESFENEEVKKIFFGEEFVKKREWTHVWENEQFL